MKNVRFVRAMAAFFVLLLVTMELPYRNRSLIELIIPPVSIGSTRLYLSGFFVLITLYMIYREVVGSKKFNLGRPWLFALIFFLMMPLGMFLMTVVKEPIYELSSGLRTIEIQRTDLALTNDGNQDYIRVVIDMEGHSNLEKGFTVALLMDDTLAPYMDERTFIVEEHVILSDREQKTLEVQIPFDMEESHWQHHDFYRVFHDSGYSLLLSQGDQKSLYRYTPGLY